MPDQESYKPPGWIHSFFLWFCKPEYQEDIEGDLLERFENRIEDQGIRVAKRLFILDVLRLFRPGLIRSISETPNLNDYLMLRNHFKIAYRHIIKNKYYALINILGLSVGMTAFFLILQYVDFEMSFDKFHQNKGEIYRVTYSQYENGELKNNSAKNYAGLITLINDHYPEVGSYTGFSKIPANTGLLFSYDDLIYNELGGVINADTNFFKVFPSLLVQGDINTILSDPNNIVLSESMAQKIFGGEDPMNKQIDRIDDHADEKGMSYIVTGIFKDLPQNSHFHANFITYQDEYWASIENYWKAPSIYTYITIQNKADYPIVEERLNASLNSIERTDPKMNGAQVFLQSITDIHLRSQLKDDFGPGGSITLVYILYAVGFIILIIAWINYLNIETARFTKRAKEVGVRRIIGSSKRNLALQFLTEYFCITTLSAGIAWFLLLLILPQYFYLTGIPINTIQWSVPMVWLGAFSLFVFGSILVGIYPTFLLLKLNPVASLKGNFGGSNGGRIVRKSLITVQFTSSLVLIAFLLVTYRQLDYMRLSNKNFDLEKVISIRNPTSYSNQELGEKHSDYITLENKMLQNPAISMISSSSAIPGTEIGFTHVNLLKRYTSDPYDPTRYKCLFVNYSFIPFYGLTLKAGRNFSKDFGEDANWKTLILNESAVHALGFVSAEDALDQEVNYSIWSWQSREEQKYKIIGIVEDYHHEAIKEEVYPTIFYLNHDSFQQVYYSMKLSAGSNPKTALIDIEKSWKEIFPKRPFDYFFLDEYYDRQFKSELHFGRIFGLFAGTVVLIACLGILAMTLFETRLRSREISIRKVLGASVSNLVALLSKQYFKLLILATLVSFPAIYFSTHKWLLNYPSRIEINGWFFILPLIVVVALVSLTSGFHTVKAARTNPVENLKDE